MAWFISKEAHYEVIKELENQTDRGAAIIGAALVEERLTEAIESRLLPNTIKKDKLLNETGPLGTFSAKIDMAYGLGFFGENSHKDLHIIRKIRNKFAHRIEPLTFTIQSISDQCNALWLPKNVLEMGNSEPPTTPRHQYLRAINILNGLIWSEITSDITKDKCNPEPPYFLPW